MDPPPAPLPVVQKPVVVKEPQLPEYISIDSPGVLLIPVTVTLTLPVASAVNWNQTLFWMVPSPQFSTGSVLGLGEAPVVERTID